MVVDLVALPDAVHVAVADAEHLPVGAAGKGRGGAAAASGRGAEAGGGSHGAHRNECMIAQVLCERGRVARAEHEAIQRREVLRA